MDTVSELEKIVQTQTVINADTVADIVFTLSYDSPSVAHTERYFARGVNFWRDILPESLYQALMGTGAGGAASFPIPPGLLYPADDPRQVRTMPMSRFRGRMPNGSPVNLQQGRYYPKGLLDGLAGVFPQNTEPFRCIDFDATHLTADLNHPLAAVNAQLRAEVRDVRSKGAERGGSSIDWIGRLTRGPGMQIPSAGGTDFLSQSPFERLDESADEHFYRTPRFVNHLDDKAIDLVESLYGRLLRPQMRVLDLMSSWVSHLPTSFEPAALTGLGMNRSELIANQRLEHVVVHDINQNPVLPFDSGSFDAVICTVSVEYMTRPLEVFAEVARVLAEGGVFIVTFSNRWFPPKVVKIWRELHDYERMGLVLEYFRDAGSFSALETLSIRGYPRPLHDRYFPELQLSDPVYAVWGQTRR